VYMIAELEYYYGLTLYSRF